MRNSQMQAVCVAPPGRLVLKGKLLAKSVVVNLWMLMDGQVAKALGALMRNLQMRAVHVVVSGRLVRRVRTMASRAVVGL